MTGADKREVGEMVFQTQTGLPSILYLLTIRCYMNLSCIFLSMKNSFSNLTSSVKKIADVFSPFAYRSLSHFSFPCF